MRRIRLPSDSPSMVTRPGVNRISIALWVTSIQDGWASGRQLEKIRRGRPAFSSANMNSIFLAAVSFQGGGLVLTWASWSLIFGFQTPLQSGSLARSAQSWAVGAGLMTVGAFLGAWAEAIEAARTMATGTAAKIPSGLTFTGSSPARKQGNVAPSQCIVKPISRPNATTAIHSSNEIAAAARAATGVCPPAPQ